MRCEEAVGVTQQAVALLLEEAATLPKLVQPAANHLTDFEPPLYNVWKQQTETPGLGHFGNSDGGTTKRCPMEGSAAGLPLTRHTGSRQRADTATTEQTWRTCRWSSSTK